MELQRLRAKFNVVKVTDHFNPGSSEKASENPELTPVYSNDPNSENASFSRRTPGGKIEMHITNPNAYGFFKGGESYYVDYVSASAEKTYPVYFTPPGTDEEGVPEGAELLQRILDLEVREDGYSYAAFGPTTRRNIRELLDELLPN